MNVESFDIVAVTYKIRTKHLLDPFGLKAPRFNISFDSTFLAMEIYTSTVCLYVFYTFLLLG